MSLTDSDPPQNRADELYASAREARCRARQTMLRAEVAMLKFDATLQQHQQAWERVRRLRELWLSDRGRRMQYSAYARLQARLASMPVIEQAKGILMAQSGWSADDAFDALRKASQRENVRVRDVAARIVATTAQVGGAPARASGTQATGRPVPEPASRSAG